MRSYRKQFMMIATLSLAMIAATLAPNPGQASAKPRAKTSATVQTVNPKDLTLANGAGQGFQAFDDAQSTTPDGPVLDIPGRPAADHGNEHQAATDYEEMVSLITIGDTEYIHFELDTIVGLSEWVINVDFYDATLEDDVTGPDNPWTYEGYPSYSDALIVPGNESSYYLPLPAGDTVCSVDYTIDFVSGSATTSSEYKAVEVGLCLNDLFGLADHLTVARVDQVPDFPDVTFAGGDTWLAFGVDDEVSDHLGATGWTLEFQIYNQAGDVVTTCCNSSTELPIASHYSWAILDEDGPLRSVKYRFTINAGGAFSYPGDNDDLWIEVDFADLPVTSPTDTPPADDGACHVSYDLDSSIRVWYFLSGYEDLLQDEYGDFVVRAIGTVDVEGPSGHWNGAEVSFDFVYQNDDGTETTIAVPPRYISPQVAGSGVASFSLERAAGDYLSIEGVPANPSDAHLVFRYHNETDCSNDDGLGIEASATVAIEFASL